MKMSPITAKVHIILQVRILGSLVAIPLHKMDQVVAQST